MTYTPILNAEVDAESPITDLLLTRLRDNPLAIGEAAAGVPLNLLPTVLLGTLTTTSGATHTLSGLVLTPYKFLRVVYNAVSLSSSGFVKLGGLQAARTTGVTSFGVRGLLDLDLQTGIFVTWAEPFGNGNSNVISEIRTATTAYTTASTSIEFSTSAGNFDAGQIFIYGVK